MDFYTGRILKIDLSASVAADDSLRIEWADRYIGGRGLLLRYLWEELAMGVDPFSPDNPLIIMTGPFAGTVVPTAGRFYIGAKSPATGILDDSCVGGSFGPELKFAGYDGIIIRGRARTPTIVTIRDRLVEFRSGSNCSGMKTSQIEQALHRRFDKEAKVLSIGPAGENRVPFACISTDQYHKAGRGGLGAVMGEKNLKAIAVRGSGGVNVRDPRGFLGLMAQMHADHVFTSDNLWAHQEGTPIFVDPVNGAGALPTRNWSAGTFEDSQKINSAAFERIRVRKRACYQCALSCRNYHATVFAGDEVHGEGPEYETIALCGANCGVGDIGALMKLNAECDEWGLDTISTGAVIGLAMDLTKREVRDFGLRFGDAESYTQVPRLIATRQGIGAELALGARALALKYERPELAMEIKGLELPGYDPRGAFGLSLAYATSDRGGCHLRATTVSPEIISGSMPSDSLAGKAAYLIQKQNFKSAKFSAVICDFWAIASEQLRTLFERLQERKFTDDDILQLGERIWNLGRLFNLREGVEKDDIPALLCDTGSDADSRPRIGRGAFDRALREFYELRGWNESGVPLETKLASLGVDVRLPRSFEIATARTSSRTTRL